MADYGLLTPGVGADDPDDDALLRALVAAENAWVHARVTAGAVTATSAQRVAAAGEELLASPGLTAALAAEAADSGNPVIPLLGHWRAQLRPDDHASLHTGLTSQDVVDTALMIVTRDSLNVISDLLANTADALVTLATQHRDTPALAHTLGQPALTTTFGARVATWLHGVAQAREAVGTISRDLPLAWGGPVGTMAQAGAHTDPTSSAAMARAWAAHLGLQCPPVSWHVVRTPVLRATAALSEVVAACGHIAGDVLLGSRAGRAELAEPQDAQRGGSSAMPHKANPILSITVRRSAVVAPHLLAQVHSAAALAADERPDGAWHAEWASLRDLCRHAIIASRATSQLTAGLVVDRESLAANLAKGAQVDEDQAASVAHAVAMVDRTLATWAGDPS